MDPQNTDQQLNPNTFETSQIILEEALFAPENSGAQILTPVVLDPSGNYQTVILNENYVLIEQEKLVSEPQYSNTEQTLQHVENKDLMQELSEARSHTMQLHLAHTDNADINDRDVRTFSRFKRYQELEALRLSTEVNSSSQHNPTTAEQSNVYLVASPSVQNENYVIRAEDPQHFPTEPSFSQYIPFNPEYSTTKASHGVTFSQVIRYVSSNEENDQTMRIGQEVLPGSPEIKMPEKEDQNIHGIQFISEDNSQQSIITEQVVDENVMGDYVVTIEDVQDQNVHYDYVLSEEVQDNNQNAEDVQRETFSIEEHQEERETAESECKNIKPEQEQINETEYVEDTEEDLSNVDEIPSEIEAQEYQQYDCNEVDKENQSDQYNEENQIDESKEENQIDESKEDISLKGEEPEDCPSYEDECGTEDEIQESQDEKKQQHESDVEDISSSGENTVLENCDEVEHNKNVSKLEEDVIVTENILSNNTHNDQMAHSGEENQEVGDQDLIKLELQDGQDPKQNEILEEQEMQIVQPEDNNTAIHSIAEDEHIDCVKDLETQELQLDTSQTDILREHVLQTNIETQNQIEADEEYPENQDSIEDISKEHTNEEIEELNNTETILDQNESPSRNDGKNTGIEEAHQKQIQDKESIASKLDDVEILEDKKSPDNNKKEEKSAAKNQLLLIINEEWADDYDDDSKVMLSAKETDLEKSNENYISLEKIQEQQEVNDLASEIEDTLVSKNSLGRESDIEKENDAEVKECLQVDNGKNVVINDECLDDEDDGNDSEILSSPIGGSKKKLRGKIKTYERSKPRSLDIIANQEERIKKKLHEPKKNIDKPTRNKSETIKTTARPTKRKLSDTEVHVRKKFSKNIELGSGSEDHNVADITIPQTKKSRGRPPKVKKKPTYSRRQSEITTNISTIDMSYEDVSDDEVIINKKPNLTHPIQKEPIVHTMLPVPVRKNPTKQIRVNPEAFKRAILNKIKQEQIDNDYPDTPNIKQEPNRDPKSPGDMLKSWLLAQATKPKTLRLRSGVKTASNDIICSGDDEEEEIDQLSSDVNDQLSSDEMVEITAEDIADGKECQPTTLIEDSNTKKSIRIDVKGRKARKRKTDTTEININKTAKRIKPREERLSQEIEEFLEETDAVDKTEQLTDRIVETLANRYLNKSEEKTNSMSNEEKLLNTPRDGLKNTGNKKTQEKPSNNPSEDLKNTKIKTNLEKQRKYVNTTNQAKRNITKTKKFFKETPAASNNTDQLILKDLFTKPSPKSTQPAESPPNPIENTSITDQSDLMTVKSVEEIEDDSDSDSRREWLPEDYAEYKHKYNMQKNTKKKTVFKCKICQKVQPSHYMLHKHKMEHLKERPYECVLCAQTFSDVKDFQAHIRLHKGKTPYQCRKCEKGFATRTDFENHQPVHFLKREPPKIKRFRCDVCSKEFAKLCDMDRHLRVHTGEKVAVCNICHKGFQQAHNLSKHLLTHLAVKPFSCEICGSKFGRIDVLNRHLLIHSVEKPFKCDFCPKGFIRAVQFEKHVKTFHPDEGQPKAGTVEES